MELQDSYINSSQPFTKTELDFLLSLVKEKPLTKADIMNISEDISGSSNYLRTIYSAQISLTILHTLAHGLLPYGVIPQEGQWQVPSRLMIEYAQSRGYDVESHIKQAKTNLEERVKALKSKKTRKVAVALLSSYFQENRKQLRADVADYREDILRDIMNGVEVTFAFQRYTK